MSDNNADKSNLNDSIESNGHNAAGTPTTTRMMSITTTAAIPSCLEDDEEEVTMEKDPQQQQQQQASATSATSNSITPLGRQATTTATTTQEKEEELVVRGPVKDPPTASSSPPTSSSNHHPRTHPCCSMTSAAATTTKIGLSKNTPNAFRARAARVVSGVSSGVSSGGVPTIGQGQVSTTTTTTTTPDSTSTNGLSKKTPKAIAARAARSSGSLVALSGTTASGETFADNHHHFGTILPPLRGIGKNQPPNQLSHQNHQQHQHNDANSTTGGRGLRKNRQNRPGSLITQNNEGPQQTDDFPQGGVGNDDDDDGQQQQQQTTCANNGNASFLSSSLGVVDQYHTSAPPLPLPPTPHHSTNNTEAAEHEILSSLDIDHPPSASAESTQEDRVDSHVTSSPLPISPTPMTILPQMIDHNTDGLAVARAIEEGDDAAVLHMEEAQEVDREELEKKDIEEHKRRECRIVGYVIMAVSLSVLTIVLGVKLGQTDPPPITLSPSLPPSTAPSESPSFSPSGALDLLGDDLPRHTLDNLKSFDTPQYKAWDWLMNHPNISNFDEWRKKQLFALGTFFFSFEGENWHKPIRESWMDYEKEECWWFTSGSGQFCLEANCEDYGLGQYQEWVSQSSSCNDHGEFISINLLGLQLSGLTPSLPPEVALLTSLSAIKLGQNDINASLPYILPSELGQLTNMTELDISHNQLYGPIPSYLGLITSMRSLALSNNRLSGRIPSELGMLTSLLSLPLVDNSLTGQLPSQLGMMTHMTKLELHRNKFGFSIPSELGMMTSLTWLDLHGNSLNVSVPSELGMMASLSWLYLHDNDLNGQLPSELGLMTGLRRLQLHRNALTGPLPTELGLMISLKILRLNGNFLNGTIPSELAILTQLNSLDLSWNFLTVPPDLVALTSTQVHLEGTDINFTFPPQLMADMKFKASGNFMLPTEIGLLTNIKTLAPRSNSLNGTVPTEAGLMTSLTHLDLHCNGLGGSIPSEIGMMTSMTLLDLSHNNLKGTVPSELGMMKHLKYLILDQNGFTGAIPSELGLTSLSNLWIENNAFTGRLPSELGLITSPPVDSIGPATTLAVVGPAPTRPPSVGLCTAPVAELRPSHQHDAFPVFEALSGTICVNVTITYVVTGPGSGAPTVQMPTKQGLENLETATIAFFERTIANAFSSRFVRQDPISFTDQAATNGWTTIFVACQLFSPIPTNGRVVMEIESAHYESFIINDVIAAGPYFAQTQGINLVAGASAKNGTSPWV